MKIFAERLKELRAEKGVTATALADAIDVSHASVIEWEHDKYEIKAMYVVRLAKYFGVSTDYLLGLED